MVFVLSLYDLIDNISLALFLKHAIILTQSAVDDNVFVNISQQNNIGLNIQYLSFRILFWLVRGRLTGGVLPRY